MFPIDLREKNLTRMDKMGLMAVPLLLFLLTGAALVGGGKMITPTAAALLVVAMACFALCGLAEGLLLSALGKRRIAQQLRCFSFVFWFGVLSVACALSVALSHAGTQPTSF